MRTIAAGLLGLVLTGCGSGEGADDRSAATASAPAEEAAPASTPTADWCPVTTEQVSDVVHHSDGRGPAEFDVSDAPVVELDGADWPFQIINIGGGSDVVSKHAEVALAQFVVAG